jgi:ClpA/ClpB-like protein
VFERFTEGARQVVVLAQEESRELAHNHIGEEHILLGLLRVEEGIAARVLEGFDVTLKQVRPEVVRLVGQGEEVRSGQIPFTPLAKTILELSLKQALDLGDQHIDTEHLLLGLVAQKKGVAARILDDLGVDTKKIRGEVLRVRPEALVQRRFQERGLPVLEVEHPIRVGLTPRARRIWLSAAAEALDAGRTAILPGDLLEPLISDETIGRVLSELGVDLPALRERLRTTAWAEPDPPEEG